MTTATDTNPKNPEHSGNTYVPYPIEGIKDKNSNLQPTVGRPEPNKEEFRKNTEKRCALVLVLDKSNSMSGEPARLLNEAVAKFKRNLIENMAVARKIDVAVVQFNHRVRLHRFQNAEVWQPPIIQPEGGTCLSYALNASLDLLNQRMDEYQMHGISYYRPWIVLLTGGYPKQDRESNLTTTGVRLRQANDRGRCNLFAITSGDANETTFSLIRERITPPRRPPKKTTEANFSELFQWLSNSMTAVSRSSPSDQIVLEDTSGWEIVENSKARSQLVSTPKGKRFIWRWLVLLAVAAVIGAGVHFAVGENPDFPSAKTIQVLEGEVEETYPRIYQGNNEPVESTKTKDERPTAPEHRPVPDPTMRHLELKQLLLLLTNEQRSAAGVQLVKMGNNPAAQLHTEAALEGCYSSHWDRWGLKPNHRYTITGGTGADAENGSGSDYCIKASDNYSANSSMELEIAEAVQGWMNSPGHRRNLLNPAHTELNIGIAYDRYNTMLAQHFASDYVRYNHRPIIDRQGILSLSANVSGATLEISDSINIQIAYDAPPQPLTRGQLSYTYSLCNPMPAAHVVEPLPWGRYYSDPEVRTMTVQHSCVDPYHTPADRPAPSSDPEAHRHWAEAKNASAQASAVQVQTVRVIAQMMTVTDTAIQVQADLSQVLANHGPGIYTVILWGRPNHMAEPTPLSEQAIFWLTRPPPEAPY